MILEWSAAQVIVVWSILGLFVGSFLNVAIHRYPYEEETVSRPRRSRCPSCRTMLTWRENVPLLSWLVQRGRCRTCRWPIPWRYPLVEVLNAVLWGLAAWIGGPEELALVAVQSIVLSALVVATFVDFDCFEIPDQVSIGGMVAAPIASFLVPQLHAHSAIARALSDGAQIERHASLAASLAGLAAGWSLLWLLGWVGSKLFGRDAMGLGDVKLLAAGGGFVGPGGALAALMLAAVVASVAGILNMARFFVLLRTRARRRGRRGGLGKHAAVARIAGRYLPFGPYLAIGIGIVLLAWNHVREWIP